MQYLGSRVSEPRRWSCKQLLQATISHSTCDVWRIVCCLLIIRHLSKLSRFPPISETVCCSRMPNNRLPKKLLFGEVKGLCPCGCPRSSFNDVAT